MNAAGLPPGSAGCCSRCVWHGMANAVHLASCSPDALHDLKACLLPQDQVNRPSDPPGTLCTRMEYGTVRVHYNVRVLYLVGVPYCGTSMIRYNYTSTVPGTHTVADSYSSSILPYRIHYNVHAVEALFWALYFGPHAGHGGMPACTSRDATACCFPQPC